MTFFNKSFFLFLLFIFLTSSFSFAFNDDIYVWAELNNDSLPTSSTIVEKQAGNFLNLTCGSAILIDQDSGQILYEHNIHEKLRPASVTKIMTLLLIMEALDNGSIFLTDSVPCSEHASSMGGSQIWLDVKETLTVDEMLKAICVVSANDCAVAMAEFISGSEDLFVEQMNRRAQELGMNDTCFKNCHGIDEDGHLTSSYDIAIMSRELLLHHPDITKYTTIWMDSLRNGKSELVSTNKLLRNYNGITGLKTGSTSTALFNISASATRNNLSLIAVIMKGESSKIRFDEAKKLLDYGFSNFEFIKYANGGNTVRNIPVYKGLSDSVEVIFEKDGGSLIPKGRNDDIVISISLPESVCAPVTSGEVIGKVNFTLDGNNIGEVNLIAKNSIKKLNYIDIVKSVFNKWVCLNR